MTSDVVATDDYERAVLAELRTIRQSQGVTEEGLNSCPNILNLNIVQICANEYLGRRRDSIAFQILKCTVGSRSQIGSRCHRILLKRTLNFGESPELLGRRRIEAAKEVRGLSTLEDPDNLFVTDHSLGKQEEEAYARLAHVLVTLAKNPCETHPNADSTELLLKRMAEHSAAAKLAAAIHTLSQFYEEGEAAERAKELIDTLVTLPLGIMEYAPQLLDTLEEPEELLAYVIASVVDGSDIYARAYALYASDDYLLLPKFAVDVLLPRGKPSKYGARALLNDALRLDFVDSRVNHENYLEAYDNTIELLGRILVALDESGDWFALRRGSSGEGVREPVPVKA
ncbi:hypothetical protein [Microbacterium sp.]|uniref:hypothetical protein n=1 Tax=Microbacterium sp. TaxID=51671 RepID=UPI001ACCAFC1|nr:hypothetical protein [Microbacterium sp.]MBN9156923.1 hypothetical protein [Microbacterium sp.]